MNKEKGFELPRKYRLYNGEKIVKYAIVYRSIMSICTKNAASIAEGYKLYGGSEGLKKILSEAEEIPEKLLRNMNSSLFNQAKRELAEAIKLAQEYEEQDIMAEKKEDPQRVYFPERLRESRLFFVYSWNKKI